MPLYIIKENSDRHFRFLKWNFFFNTLKPLHGIKMAHSIRKTHYLCVNMCANTGNIFSYAQNINLMFGETSKITETYVSPVKVEKRCINWNTKVLQCLLWQ